MKYQPDKAVPLFTWVSYYTTIWKPARYSKGPTIQKLDTNLSGFRMVPVFERPVFRRSLYCHYNLIDPIDLTVVHFDKFIIRNNLCFLTRWIKLNCHKVTWFQVLSPQTWNQWHWFKTSFCKGYFWTALSSPLNQVLLPPTHQIQLGGQPTIFNLNFLTHLSTFFF